MGNEVLSEIAQKAKKLSQSFTAQKGKKKGLSYLEWMRRAESAIINDAIIATSNATVGIYDAEKRIKNPQIATTEKVMGENDYSDFPEIERLRFVRDEKDRLYEKKMEIIRQRNERNEKLTSEGEMIKKKGDKATEEEKARFEKKKLAARSQEKKETKKIDEYSKKIDATHKEWVTLSKKLDEFAKGKEQRDMEKARQEAKNDRAENARNYVKAQDDEYVNRIALLCTAKDELQKRTWKDFLFHPFRSIAENRRYSEMRQLVLDEYDITEKELDATVSVIGNGNEENVKDVEDILEDGTVKKTEAEKKAPEKTEVKAEEKEDLKEKLDNTFASEKVQKAEKAPAEPNVPAVENPTIQ